MSNANTTRSNRRRTAANTPGMQRAWRRIQGVHLNPYGFLVTFPLNDVWSGLGTWERRDDAEAVVSLARTLVAAEPNITLDELREQVTEVIPKHRVSASHAVAGLETDDDKAVDIACVERSLNESYDRGTLGFKYDGGW